MGKVLHKHRDLDVPYYFGTWTTSVPGTACGLRNSEGRLLVRKTWPGVTCDNCKRHKPKRRKQ